MEQLINEQTEAQSQAAEAEEKVGEENGEVSLGKFKDVKALQDAYSSLEAEFTKRCQKIKELESALKEVDKEKSPTTFVAEEKKKDVTQEEKEKILKEYLSSVIGKKQQAIVMDGGGVGVKTPKSRPRSINEAGILAREIFENKGEK